MSEFLYSLGQVVDQQFNLSGNKGKTLDGDDGDGNNVRYGALGAFANRFDKTAERKYFEEGYTKHSMNPKVFQVMSQTPDVTVVIKKKEFSSLKINNQPQYQDKEDKLFLRAASVLFKNKCNQIAMYERLTKLETIARLQQNIDYGLLPILLNTFDAAAEIPGLKELVSNTKFSKAMEQVRKLVQYSSPAFWTTWTEDPNRLFKSTFGTGTGVVELTTVSTINVTSSIKWGGGGCSFSLEDPYGLMRITEKDVEQAISDAVNPFNRSSFVKLARESSQGLIEKNKRLLNLKRARRGANALNFIVNPDTFLGKQTRVVVEGLGFEINFNASANLDFGSLSDVGDLLSGHLKTEFDPSSDFGSEELGIHGLKDDEKSLISTILDSITSLISLDTNSRTAAKKNAKETNRCRRRMMLHYCGKPIIQAMDVVHVYMDSKSKNDVKIMAGLQSSFTGFGSLQNISKQVSDLGTQFKTLFNPSNASVDIEKSVFVGKDFPNYLWSMMRNQFVTDKAGTHVFAGLIQHVDCSWAAGRGYSLSVKADDNTKYFSLGQVNFTPSIQNSNGPLLDPVTPFEINIDSSTGTQKEAPQLLDENKKFYAQATPRYVAGPLSGVSVSDKNFGNQDSDVGFQLPAGSQPNVVQNIFYPPDGTVYRWKEGIGTLTLSRNTYGNAFNTSVPAQNITRITTEEAFAGQDLMNVISLLITGDPYNFATFYKNIMSDFKQDYFNDPSYFRNLQKDLQKNNKLWGDFQPFKKLIISEASFAQMMQGTLSVVANNSKLDDLLQQRAETFDKVARSSSSFGIGSAAQLNSSNIQIARLQELDAKIAEAQISIGNAIGSGAKFYQIFGDDISFDVDKFSNTVDSKSALNNPSIRKELRRKINFLTRRLFYTVKANEDRNLFIVDDSYDKDLDLQQFSKAIGSRFSMFLNEYDNVASQIQALGEKLDFEIFADSQGHIQARPPQFNRVPNSVFLKLLQNKEERGIQIFPQFLQDLYSNQLQGMFNNIAIIENQIRLQAAALSIESDDRIGTELITDDDTARKFQFLSDPDTGDIANINIAAIIAAPDVNNIGIVETLSVEVSQQAREVRFAFTSAARSTLLVTRFSETSAPNPIPIFDSSNPTLTTRVDTVSNNLRRQTGVRPESISKLFGKPLPNGSASAMDVFRITKQIATLIAQRQNMVKSAAGALKAVNDALRTTVDADKINSSTISKLAFPNLYGQKDVPEILEHMIEDESYDDYGPGSGSRYIVKDSQLLSFNYGETPPEFNSIQVNGLFEEGLAKAAEDLQLANGGNAQTTAYAVDYDMWRMYGFKPGNTITVPSMSDPETQLAPYAVTLLNRARGQILTGSLSMAGNEFMQAGEVIYLEPTNMLWYVESVNHSFSFGTSFTTSLTLSYGHNPGEYIPTAFDVVGKVLYKNRDTANNIIIKEDNAYNEKSIGTLAFSQTSFVSDEPINAIKKDAYGDVNINTIINLQYALVGILNSTNESAEQPAIEIRFYYYSKGTGKVAGVNTNIEQYADFVKSLITGGASRTTFSQLFGQNTPPVFPKKSVTLVPVDLSDATVAKSPSGKAWNFARGLAAEKGTAGGNALQERLVDGVIDIWLTFVSNK